MGSAVLQFALSTCLLLLLLPQYAQADAIEGVLSLFDMDFDDLVVEDGETWFERYNIRRLKRCNLKMPSGQAVSLAHLARDSPPDYSFKKGEFTYFFNVCRNTIKTCKGHDDNIAIQFDSGKMDFE